MPVVPDSEFVPAFNPGMQIPRVEGLPYNTTRATPESFGGQVGQTLEQAGNMFAQHAVARQQLLNEANVNDVYANQFSPRFRDLQNEFMKLEGKDAEARFPEYEQKMNDLRAQFRDGFPNMVQQKLFDERSTRRAEMDLDGMSRYAASQTKAWEWNTHTAVMADLAAEGAANYNDPQRLQNVRDRLDNETADYGSKHGWSAEVFRYQVGKNNDDLWSAVIKRQALDDPVGAMKTYQEQVAAGRISGNVQGELYKYIKPLAQVWDARNFVSGLVSGGQASSGGGSLQAALVNQESGGRDYKEDGTAVTSVKGAKYAWQVMPSTAANPGFGIAPAKSDTAEEYNRVGQELFGALQNKYGDNMLALASYNAGSGTIDNLIAKYGDPRTGAISQDDFISHLPVTKDNDTQAYVRNILAKAGQPPGQVTIGGGQGGSMIAPAKPAPGGMTVEDLERALPGWERQVVERYPDNETAQRQALSILHTNVQSQISTLRKVAQADVSYIERAILDPKGPPDLPTFLQDPKNVEVYNRLLDSNPAALFALNRQFAQNAEDKRTAITPETQARYDTLYHEAVYDPDTFVNRNLAVEKGNVPDNGLTKLINLKDAIIANDATEQGKITRLKTAMDIAKGPAVNAGIYDPNKAAGKQSSGWKAYTSKMEQAVTQFEADNSRRPKEAEIKQIATDLLQKVTVPGNVYGSSQIPLFAMTPGQETRASMPKEQVTQYSQDFTKAYGRDPFPGELDQLYFATKLHPGDKDMLRQIDSQIRQDSLRLIPAGSRTAAPAWPGVPASSANPYPRGPALPYEMEYLNKGIFNF